MKVQFTCSDRCGKVAKSFCPKSFEGIWCLGKWFRKSSSGSHILEHDKGSRTEIESKIWRKRKEVQDSMVLPEFSFSSKPSRKKIAFLRGLTVHRNCFHHRTKVAREFLKKKRPKKHRLQPLTAPCVQAAQKHPVNRKTNHSSLNCHEYGYLFAVNRVLFGNTYLCVGDKSSRQLRFVKGTLITQMEAGAAIKQKWMHKKNSGVEIAFLHKCVCCQKRCLCLLVSNSYILDKVLYPHQKILFFGLETTELRFITVGPRV